jgi:DNA-binding response OmpR family regulator
MARILIVNDELDLLKLCQLALCDVGHQVDIFTSGSQALECARFHRPDLMIVDWVMPDGEGGALLARLKGYASTRDIPVLAISALADGALRAQLAGADRFLAKPFDIDELLDAVNHVLRRSSHRRRAAREEALPD